MVINIPISLLVQTKNTPYQNNIFGSITEQDVIDCIRGIEEGSLEPVLISLSHEIAYDYQATTEEHCRRIATLVLGGWDCPITIQSSYYDPMSLIEYEAVTDGNHRVAAAIILGYDFIKAKIKWILEK